MSLSAGTRLGPYEILALAGAGGMGEVYQARDTRLNRIVAIKVAKERLSDRFEREARVVAALNHPRAGPIRIRSSADRASNLHEDQRTTQSLSDSHALRSGHASRETTAGLNCALTDRV